MNLVAFDSDSKMVCGNRTTTTKLYVRVKRELCCGRTKNFSSLLINHGRGKFRTETDNKQNYKLYINIVYKFTIIGPERWSETVRLHVINLQ